MDDAYKIDNPLKLKSLSVKFTREQKTNWKSFDPLLSAFFEATIGVSLILLFSSDGSLSEREFWPRQRMASAAGWVFSLYELDGDLRKDF